MLKQLNIKNIILIESSSISFSSGLNVISGETGSGKSALLNAIQLIKGEKTDTAMIRRGEEKGYVEALFDITQIADILPLLDEYGIDHDAECDLIIAREISITGRSRAFINNQHVQLSILKKVCVLLFDIIGQHSHTLLREAQNYGVILDLYGAIAKDALLFGKSWQLENQIKSQLNEMIQSESQRQRDIERYSDELKEIEGIHIKEGEEETLFDEYSLLSNAQELLDHTETVVEGLAGEKNAILPHLKRHKGLLEQISRFSPILTDAAKGVENAIAELQEVSYTLRNFSGKVECNPTKMQHLENRLKEIEKIKKKYGPKLEEVFSYREQLKLKLESLTNANDQIEQLSHRLKELEEENNERCRKLTADRAKAAKDFEKRIEAELQMLNMPNATFTCAIKPQKRSRTGDDCVEFFLKPNIGENNVSVQECASGGELSRLMLAVQVLLSGKKDIPTLIFDEIDSNIGGETAVVVGKKLREIGTKQQVLCITHFPQVAKQADHHLKIEKMESGGRTHTRVSVLDSDSKTVELERMVGGRHR